MIAEAVGAMPEHFRVVAFCEKWGPPGGGETRYYSATDVPIPDWDAPARLNMLVSG